MVKRDRCFFSTLSSVPAGRPGPFPFHPSSQGKFGAALLRRAEPLILDAATLQLEATRW